MQFKEEEIQYIAHLARLELAAEEVPEYQDKLSRIINLVDELSAANTEGVVPMAHPLNMTQRLRPDAVTAANERDKNQQNAADTAEGFYRVPRVIE